MSRPHSLALVMLLAACDSSPAAMDGGPDDAALVEDLDAHLALLDGGVPLDAVADEDALTSPDAWVEPPTDAAPRCPSRPSLGLFVWGDDLVTRRDAILTLAADADVTEIYLHANLFYAGDEDEDTLADWIRAADALCISVELLFGNARWIRTASHDEATDRNAWTVAFAAAHPDARPSGIHFDLEPQQLDAWDVEADRPGLIAELVDVLEEMTPVAEAGGVPLSIDIGFFLDGYEVTRGGRTRPGHEWITDAVSRVVVMDYRDSAESMGYGGMISLAEDEVTYASSTSTPIVLAAETISVSPEYVTFREEGRAALFAEHALVRAHFPTSSALAGFAIHDERGLAALAP
ncbi:MAG: hypothetical protein J0L92_18080 [Deltaproteobacteria bacterium]|nr:hypothetical protein [Deltaproteobacteria bacterium]